MNNKMIIGIILVLVIGIGIYGVSKINLNKNSSSEVPDQKINENVKNIEISNFEFTPNVLTVNIGETVVWTNKDSASHTVTSDNGNELNSEALATGKSYSHLFSQTGEFEYHCNFHTMMKAKIIVK